MSVPPKEAPSEPPSGKTPRGLSVAAGIALLAIVALAAIPRFSRELERYEAVGDGTGYLLRVVLSLLVVGTSLGLFMWTLFNRVGARPFSRRR